MLADFQQALADLVAAPDKCQSVRDGDDSCLDGYDLTATEWARLLTIVRHRGMSANCAVYRSNRLTPIVVHLPGTCAALGNRFRDVIDRFWSSHPTQHFVHFLVESDRFATFLENHGADLLPARADAAVRTALAREAASVRAGLAATVA